MTRKMKKALSLIIAILMVLSSVPVGGLGSLDFTFATKASALDARGSLGENITYTFDETTGAVTISGTGKTEDYFPPSSIREGSPFASNLNVKSVTVSEGVTDLGNSLFWGCKNITNVSLPDSLESIGGMTFFNTNVSNIVLPDKLTSMDSSSFSRYDSESCYESVSIGKGLTDFSLEYFGSNLIKTLSVSSENPNLVLDNGVLFNKDKTTLLYYSCGKTDKEYTVPDTVLEIATKAFEGAKLETLTVPNANTIQEKSFTDCAIDNLIILSGTTIARMACGSCTVKTITLPVTITEIGYAAFALLDGLNYVYFKGTKAQWDAIIIGDANYPLDSATICCDIDSAKKLGDNVYYVLDSASGEVTIFGSGDMYNYNGSSNKSPLESKGIKSAKIGEGITSIGDYLFNFNGWFNSVKLPTTLKRIGKYAFRTGNSRLTSITLPEGLETICEGAFYNGGFSSVTIPKSVKTIEPGAFDNCYNLASLTVDADNANYTSIDNVLFNKDKTTLVLYPQGKLDESYCIPAEVTTIEKKAFYCTSIKSIIMTDNVKTIGESAFNYCFSFTDVYYAGTEEAWNSITINSNNDPLINANIIFNHTHSVSNYVVVKNGTCENGGTRNGMCVCGMCVETETISTAHSFGDVQHKDVDCVNDGYDYKQCTDCKKYFPSDAAINATNGKDDTSSFVTPATGHSDGKDGNDNLCDKCYAYIGDISLRVGTNITVPITYAYDSHDTLVKFVPDKTAQYIISSNADPDDRNTWPVITVYSLTDGILEYAANDSNSKTKNFNLSTYTFTAGQVYCISFRNYKENAEAYTVNVALGCEHPSTKQTCMGYYCEACGLYYGRRDSSKHELDTVQTCSGYKCKHCNRYFGDAAPDNHIWDTDGMCTACYTWHDHKTFDENGMCTVCKYALPYVLISGTTTTYYGTFPDALAAAKDGDTIKMQNDDASSYSSVEITKAITLDLNGHALTQPSSESFDVKANVTFTDSVGGSYCEYGIVLYTSCTFSGGGYRYIDISTDFETEDNLGDYLAACCDYYNYSFSFYDGVGTVGSLLDLSSQKNTYDIEDKVMIKANHSTVAVSAQETTCTKAGHTAGEYCENCDYTTVTKTGDATGHTFGAAQHKDADCLSGGYDYKQCSNCSKYFPSDAAINATNGKDDYSSFTTQKLNHSYTGTIKMDKDGKNGTHSFKCVNGCGQYGGTVAHDWDGGTVTTPATHLNEGVKTFTCTCGATYTEPVSKLEGHTYVPTVVEPTCTEQGYTEHKCACGDSYKDTYVDALGHNYVDGTCDNCGKVQPSDCTCLCHQNTLVKFIYMLLDVILTLLGSGFDCRCGESHF